jgi:hypothetical protein
MARHPGIVPPSLNVPALLTAPWESVRLAALGVLEAIDHDLAIVVARQLVDDPSAYVRRNLLGFAERSGDDALPILEALANDVDAYIRSGARLRLGT